MRVYPVRLLKREKAAEFCGVSPTTFDAWVLSGRVPEGHKAGGNRLWDIWGLDAAIDRLIGLAGNENLRDSEDVSGQSVWDG